MKREELLKNKQQLEEERIKQTVTLVTRFLQYNESDKGLEKVTGISSSTVGRRLTDQDYILLAYDQVKEELLKKGWDEKDIPNTGEKLYEFIAQRRKENKYIGQLQGGNKSAANAAYLKNKDGKFMGSVRFSLELLSDTEQKQYRLLAYCALQFRLHLNTISNLFKIDENELYDKIFDYNYDKWESLKYLFNYDNSEEQVDTFIAFYRSYINSKDANMKKCTLHMLSDSKVKKIKDNHVKGDILTDEEFVSIIKYQLKYGYSDARVSREFDLERSSYHKRLNRALEKHPEYKEPMERLKEYHNAMYYIAKDMEKRG